MKPAYFFGVAALAGIAVAGWLSFGSSDNVPDAPLIVGGAQLNGKPTEMVQVTIPELENDLALGARAFEAKCAACHGPSAGGLEGSGPPLIHKIYEPSHHGDAAFFRAAELGVRAHHWTFGNMPPVEGITRAEIGEIVKYLRAVQRANGIL
ncbi:c-type cytochrome [Aliiroseovarius sp. S253]|uniref:c-type cytochrome n=1 Tax=Aliiroseovarius sp. S253 TaxID=3415133 RepID=UPI003C7B66A1